MGGESGGGGGHGLILWERQGTPMRYGFCLGGQMCHDTISPLDPLTTQASPQVGGVREKLIHKGRTTRCTKSKSAAKRSLTLWRVAKFEGTACQNLR